MYFFVKAPLIFNRPTTGKIPPIATKVNFQETKERITIVNMIKRADLKNIEMFVLSPSWMIAVSYEILLNISPTLVSSKKAVSLLIK